LGCWHRACSHTPAEAHCANQETDSRKNYQLSRKERKEDDMNASLKTMVLGLALVTVLAGLSACAKRPMVIGGSSAPAPSASVTPAPTR
jgi:hypothetical protein